MEIIDMHAPELAALSLLQTRIGALDQYGASLEVFKMLQVDDLPSCPDWPIT
jgi:hypothetical protein